MWNDICTTLSAKAMTLTIFLLSIASLISSITKLFYILLILENELQFNSIFGAKLKRSFLGSPFSATNSQVFASRFVAGAMTCEWQFNYSSFYKLHSTLLMS
jgi:hypothetical protein